MALSGFSINLVLVEKIATGTFRFSDMHATGTLWHIYWRSGILKLMEEAHLWKHVLC